MKLTKEYLNTLPKGKLNKRVELPDGRYAIYDTYMIPVKDLTFNVNNGRINLAIAKYEGDEQNLPLAKIKEINVSEFNKMMIDFIKKSGADNEVSFNKTKDDISNKGQIVPGIALEDGTVIDGNRRLACLMELYNENNDEKYAYFQACVLSELNQQQIQTVELLANFNNEGIRPYELLPTLTMLYVNVLDPITKKYSNEKYMKLMKLNQKDFDNQVHLIKIMLDFLEWNDTAKQFWLVDDNHWLEPLIKIADAKINDDTWHQNRDYFYNMMKLNKNFTNSFSQLLSSLKKRTKMFEVFSQEYDKQIDVNIIDEYNDLTNKNNLTINEEAKKEQMFNFINTKMNDSLRFAQYKQDTHNSCDVISLIEKTMKNLHQKINEHNLTFLSANDQAILKEKIADLKQYLTKLDSCLTIDEETTGDN